MRNASFYLLLSFILLVALARADDKTTPQKMADVIDLGAYRQKMQMKKLYGPLFEQLNILRLQLPPVDHSDWHREDAERSLRNLLDDLKGKDKMIRLAQIRMALDSLDLKQSGPARAFAKLREADKPLVLERFLLAALKQADGSVKLKDLLAIDRRIQSPALHEALLDYAFDHSEGNRQLLDLLAAAFSNRSLDAATPPEVYSRLYWRAFALFSGDGAVKTESSFLEQFLRTRVLNRFSTPYDRAHLLRSMAPLLTQKIDQHLIAALADIADADWLPTDVSANAQRLLRRWQFTGIGRDRGLEQELSDALSPIRPSTRRPFDICMALLLGRKPR